PQSLNSYSYANGNPITSKDPNGKQFVDVNAAYASNYFVGPSADYYYVPGRDNSDPYINLGISIAKPGLSGGATYSPKGDPPRGWTGSFTLFSKYGGVAMSPAVAPGFSYPRGVSLNIGYSMRASQWSNLLGGPFEKVTTPATSFTPASANLGGNNQG